MTKVYIAGPMSGIPFHNFPAFDAAAKHLRDTGLLVVSPAEMDRKHGYTPNKEGTISRQAYNDFLRRDIAQLTECDAIYLLVGWQNSRGACIERRVAGDLGLTIMYQPVSL